MNQRDYNHYIWRIFIDWETGGSFSNYENFTSQNYSGLADMSFSFNKFNPMTSFIDDVIQIWHQ